MGKNGGGGTRTIDIIDVMCYNFVLGFKAKKCAVCTKNRVTCALSKIVLDMLLNREYFNPSGTRLFIFCHMLCLTDTNECSSDPCQNGALCVDVQNQFNCVCAVGFEGIYCETGKPVNFFQ